MTTAPAIPDSGILPRFTMLDNGNGTWTVKDVPVFAACRFGPKDFDEAWVDRALANMLKEQESGHAFPMHIHHTTDPTAVVEPAGAFKVTRKGPVRLRGTTAPGLIGDLTFTSPDAAKRCENFQLLWRSPEIKPTGPERLRSLALLDREPPHLPMEVLAVRKEKAANAAPAPTWTLAEGGTVFAFSERGESIYALMEPQTMAATDPVAAPAKPKYRRKADGTFVLLNASGAEEVIAFEEEKKDPPAAEPKKDDAPKGDGPPKADGEGGGKCDPVKTLLDKIKEMELTREQHKALEAGIAEIFKDEGAGVSDAPGDVSMKESDAVVKLREQVLESTSRLTALEVANKAAAEEKKRKDAVAKGVARLAGRQTPSTLEADLISMAEAQGVEGVERTVALLEKSLPPRVNTLADALRGEPTDGTPAEVLAFHAKGPEAYAQAQRIAALHGTLMKTYYKDNPGKAPALKDFLEQRMGASAFAPLADAQE